jgi:alpha,alpha-trehalase
MVRTPIDIYGEMFVDFAMSNVIRDGKALVDMIPKLPVEDIKSNYDRQKIESDFDMLAFIDIHFEFSKDQSTEFNSIPNTTCTEHIHRLWPILTRQPDKVVEGSSLLPMRHDYVVPGGRFNEVYYWDSYFTMLGLKTAQRFDLIENMIENFADQIRDHGHIPNGNRSYYLSRSQPPFFSVMVSLLAEKAGDMVYSRYRDVLMKEHKYWTKGHKVGQFANEAFPRYFDALDIPRIEMYRADMEAGAKSKNDSKTIFRNLRSAAESGWDFSSRWMTDPGKLDTVEVIDIAPVDLACLIWHLEDVLSKAWTSDLENHNYYRTLSLQRADQIKKHFWNEAEGYFFDIHLPTSTLSTAISAAGLFPLAFGLATDAQGQRALDNMQKNLLRAGGVVTTNINSGQQWDAPNGWAPLQWIAYVAASNYGRLVLATEIATRWTSLNESVFANTGKMLEKYNVEDLDLISGGGEYPVQDGFGWTNGVYLAFREKLAT